MARRMLIAGNWKMNGLRQSLGFFEEIRTLVEPGYAVDVLVAPPATLVQAAAQASNGIFIAGQDCHVAESGAHTGDISAAMLKDAGATHVIVGHSERRSDHGERSETVRQKAEAAQSAGLVPIICVGEQEEDRRAGRHTDVVGEQLDASNPGNGDFIIAYEPVWAIGTGLTASVRDIAAMHEFIRGRVAGGASRQILYGGSVKPDNAAEILDLDDVDGALVGGASLKASDFAAIISAAS
ncbi:triose-phosphate isomerase [Hyphobacterium sp. HN65]|uniref:Triosephosphate isomerase n=1 Tax=Hyphobacterium lacteum TaxID=3116575 RepID=A0ABU7LLV7_9PROT|nr:triose-phosphate isomerase [Hyphobacterium sp. HN65]MEE2524913.1 triose-phosphate isomerase [Hyphobacterium sp. HN65]